MHIVHQDQRIQHQNSSTCRAFEYPVFDADINGAVVELDGRYPALGRASNTQCKEMAYVINGSGKIVVEGKDFSLAQGDVILILAGEKFFWDGVMTLFISCSPAWNHEQHEYIA